MIRLFSSLTLWTYGIKLIINQTTNPKSYLFFLKIKIIIFTYKCVIYFFTSQNLLFNFFIQVFLSFLTIKKNLYFSYFYLVYALETDIEKEIDSDLSQNFIYSLNLCNYHAHASLNFRRYC